MKNLGQIKSRFLAKYAKCTLDEWDDVVGECLKFALEGYELAPFELSTPARDVVQYVEHHACVDKGSRLWILYEELLRAQRTLVPKQAEPGDYSEAQVEAVYDAAIASAMHDDRCHLRAALAAAGVPAQAVAEPLSKELRREAEWCAEEDQPFGGTARRVAEELLRRCAEPKPKQRTPAELADEVKRGCTGAGFTHAAESAFAELVRLATEKQK